MRYSAFISYSHVDEKIARWLMRRLESFRVPAKLVGTQGEFGSVPKRIGKVFRDRDELASAGDLGRSVNQALLNSNALIVICSPQSAQSKWVNAEIAEFRKLGHEERIFSFIVSGDPQSRQPNEGCFPASLIEPKQPGEPEREPLAADARDAGDGRDRAFLKLAAGLLGVGFDALAQRDAQRRFKRMATITAGSLLGMSMALVLAVTAYMARNDAQRRQEQAEDIVGFMLGDLRHRLETVGRLDLMRSVDDKAIDYFSNLNSRDLSDRTLEEQARSLTGIGEVRLDEGNYQEAMAAFKEAHLRTSALYERAPENAQRLFDLSQAEYWRGYVAWEQGRLDDAEFWLAQYRDSAIKLAAMDPSRFDWQREAAYGYHNMAVLDESRGKFRQAEQSMLAERKLYQQWIEQYPEDLELRYEAANVDSWLGSISLKQGKLREAKGYFSQQLHAIEQNINDDPDNIDWKEIKMTSLKLLAQATEDLGDYQHSLQLYQKAFMLAEQLHAQDPINVGWMLELGNCHWHLSNYQTDNANNHLQEAKRLTQHAYELNTKDERTAVFLADIYISLGRQAHTHGDHEQAVQSAELSQHILQPFWHQQASESVRATYARSAILQGVIHRTAGNTDLAKAQWEKAKSMLIVPRGAELPFIRLPELVSTLVLLGDELNAAAHQKRLSAANFVYFNPVNID